MKERPILFSGAMVRALLAGTKTQTRRVVKHKFPHLDHEPWHATGRVLSDLPTQPGAWMEFRHREQDRENYAGSRASTLVPCPYGQRGDRLWVRETWQYADWTEEGEPWIRYRANDAKRLCEHSPPEWADRIMDTWAGLSAGVAIGEPAADRKWRPAIHMPRWASRLTLEITNVRVERLQDISAEDCIAEGVTTTMREHDAECDLRDQYRALWEQINGAGAWDANPWVWAVSFKRLS